MRFLLRPSTRAYRGLLDFALCALHVSSKEKKHKGIIHGDIKPDNILIDKNGNLSLSDFGCARYTDEPIEQPGLVTYLSPELLKIYTNMDEILSSDQGKSDIWSLGVTLKSVLTGTCPIESHNQAAIDAMNSMSRKTNGYFIREIKPTPVANQEVYTEELAEWVADLKLDWEIEQEPLQIKEFRTKVDAYLQSETCKNLESKKIIEDLCQNLSHAKIDKSVVLGHLTSSMLLPEEQRPTAENLSETMDKLAHYFPYDPKKNFEFVKKMIVEKDVSSLTCQKENKYSQTQENLILSSKREAHKELLDQTSRNGTINKVKTKVENNQSTQTQVTPKLSSNRATHKELLDKAQGVTSVSSFLYSHTTQKNKTEKNKFEMDKKNPIMTIKK